MLHAVSTKFNAGVTLLGDTQDLLGLHECITYFASESGPLPAFHDEFLFSFAYDVRHAYQGDRRSEPIGRPEKGGRYWAFDTLWPTALVYAGMMRAAAAFVPTTKFHQAMLYQLEFCLERALDGVDAKISRDCMEWMRNFTALPENYLINFVFEQANRYVFENTSARRRISSLPSVLRDISPMSERYRRYAENLERIAIERKCSPHDLHDFTEWSEIKW